ncbi:MAG: hypothetical protein K9H64_20365 [Bacteroidales bacterium]|nr:hypothetical protein [Bacteroidales bacterium]MCF8458399.1 hypothetical protein [Bacteroidales bacterium]
MDDNIEKSDEELEKLRAENAAKQMKLMMQYGMDFSTAQGSKDLPPEIEGQFLDSVGQFEEQYQNAKQVSLYDFIGKPEFRKEASIPQDEIKLELDKLEQILADNGIGVDSICEVEVREIYRFITEELFLHEIDDMRMPGWMTHFTYEEFHPNHEYDIREHSTDFINSFLNKESDYYKHYLTIEAEANKWFESFRNSFSSFNLTQFDIQGLDFVSDNATLLFYINFEGTIDGGSETQTYSGHGKIGLRYVFEYWCIDTVVFPLG